MRSTAEAAARCRRSRTRPRPTWRRSSRPRRPSPPRPTAAPPGPARHGEAGVADLVGEPFDRHEAGCCHQGRLDVIGQRRRRDERGGLGLGDDPGLQCADAITGAWATCSASSTSRCRAPRRSPDMRAIHVATSRSPMAYMGIAPTGFFQDDEAGGVDGPVDADERQRQRVELVVAQRRRARRTGSPAPPPPRHATRTHVRHASTRLRNSHAALGSVPCAHDARRSRGACEPSGAR